MKEETKVPRERRELSENGDRRLQLYALAASAAGVSLLALVQPAAADVVYTAVHKQVNPNSTLAIDFNNDGVTDFDIRLTTAHTSAGSIKTLHAVPVAGGGVDMGPSTGWPAVLSAGEKIGPPKKFFPAAAIMIGYANAFDGTYWGPWAYYGVVKDRYLGVKFLIDGQIHYGWVRVNTELYFPDIEALVTAYAYETVANQPILAGDEGLASANQGRPTMTPAAQPTRIPPAGLGMLALGARGLAIWRREERTSEE